MLGEHMNAVVQQGASSRQTNWASKCSCQKQPSDWGQEICRSEFLNLNPAPQASKCDAFANLGIPVTVARNIDSSCQPCTLTPTGIGTTYRTISPTAMEMIAGRIFTPCFLPIIHCNRCSFSKQNHKMRTRSLGNRVRQALSHISLDPHAKIIKVISAGSHSIFL